MSCKYNNIIFDDVTKKIEDGLNDWSQICDECAKKYNIPNEKLDLGSGHGICGVEGCDNEADHYVDFKEGELEECVS